jgi:hypothetical protein
MLPHFHQHGFLLVLTKKDYDADMALMHIGFFELSDGNFEEVKRAAIDNHLSMITKKTIASLRQMKE